MRMRSVTGAVRWGLVFLLLAAIWVPGMPWVVKLVTVLPAALLLPGRSLLVRFGHRCSWGSALALSPLLVAALSWPAAELTGSAVAAARLAVSLWAGFWAFAEGAPEPGAPASPPEAPLSRPGLVALAAVLALAALPLLLNPTLWTRAGAGLLLPLLGELRGGALPPANPFLAGTPFGRPWAFAAALAPVWAATGVPGPLFLVLLQLAAVGALLLAGLRWTARAGGGGWAQAAFPAVAAGGITLLGLVAPGHGPAGPLPPLHDPRLLRAMIAFGHGDPVLSGLLPMAWGAGPLPWTAALLVAAGSVAAGPRFRLRAPVLGVLLAGAVLFQPLVGGTGTLLWGAWRLGAAGRSGFAETALALLVAAVGALPTLLLAGGGDLSRLPDFLLLTRAPSPPAALLWSLAPLLAGAAVAGGVLRGRRGWLAAAGTAAVAAFALPGLGAGASGLAWAALAVLGVPIALGLERLARRPAGAAIAGITAAALLATPVAMIPAARRDTSGATRWTGEEKEMLVRADAALPLDTVLLYPLTPRPVSEEQMYLPRAAFLGPPMAVTASVPEGDPAVRSEVGARRTLLDRFQRGHDPLALLDSVAVAVAPHPLAFVVSSEDLARTPALLESILPTVARFQPVENGRSLKILRYVKRPLRKAGAADSTGAGAAKPDTTGP